MPTDALIVDDSARPWLAARTLRSLASLDSVRPSLVLASDLARHLARADRALWLLDAGAMARGGGPLPLLSPATLTVGAVHASDGAPSLTSAWSRACLAAPAALDALCPDLRPRIASVHVSEPRALAEALSGGAPLVDALYAAARARSWRIVRDHRLDVTVLPSRLVAVTIVTTLHRGGAERLVVDLHRDFGARGVDATLVVLDAPSRATFPTPERTRLAYDRGRTRRDRVAALCRIVSSSRADVVHAHLLDGDELEAVASVGVPLVTTLHNSERGWPDGALGAASSVRLTVGCARSVASSWSQRAKGPTRVALNGAPPQRPRDDALRRDARRALALSGDALVLLAPANIRRQKRLDRIPAIVRELVRRGLDAHAVIAGEPLGSSVDGSEAERALSVEAEREGVTMRIHRVGSQLDLTPLRSAADVHVTTSDWEGLSIAQLESVDAGLPVVSTDVDGARDLADAHPGVRLVSRDADARAWADAVAQSLASAPSPLDPGFSLDACARRHLQLYAHATRTPLAASDAVVFVSNHLFTGGAQSSLRRLLAAMHARGADCRLALLEEHDRDPSPGLVELTALGVPVTVAPHAARHDPWRGACHVLAYARACGARAIVFWNAIAEHKVLIADGAIDHAVYDVSPGEMCFASLERYLRSPRAEVPVRTSRDYGALLEGLVVKYERERERAEGAFAAPVFVIANGVEVPPEAEPRPSRGPLRLGTLARIGADKKLEQLLDALALAHPNLPPYELCVGGAREPGEERYAEDLRARHPHLPIRWEGEVESRRLLGELDVFALVAEPAGCPNASLEAMAAGLPVVATDVGGMNEQVVDGVTGRLVPRGDVVALAGALVSLARASTAARAAMGREGRARVSAQFSLDRMVERYANLLGIALRPRC